LAHRWREFSGLGQPALEPDTRLLAAFPASVALLFTGHTAQARQVVDDAFPIARRLGPKLREYAWAVLAMWWAYGWRLAMTPAPWNLAEDTLASARTTPSHREPGRSV
jgi:hypothetical protein